MQDMRAHQHFLHGFCKYFSVVLRITDTRCETLGRMNPLPASKAPKLNTSVALHTNSMFCTTANNKDAGIISLLGWNGRRRSNPGDVVQHPYAGPADVGSTRLLVIPTQHDLDSSKLRESSFVEL
jgi:hypothetical protein